MHGAGIGTEERLRNWREGWGAVFAARQRQAGAAQGDEPSDFSFRRRLKANVRWLDTQPEQVAAGLLPNGASLSREVAPWQCPLRCTGMLRMSRHSFPSQNL